MHSSSKEVRCRDGNVWAIFRFRTGLNGNVCLSVFVLRIMIHNDDQTEVFVKRNETRSVISSECQILAYQKAVMKDERRLAKLRKHKSTRFGRTSKF